jgi:DNA polymerase Ligase (LigD)
MLRYVILEHDYPVLHWDLMLEAGPFLRTWRLASPPAEGRIIVATPLGDHRLIYLDYEGPLSGDRGAVSQWDRGVFEAIAETDELVAVRLRGRRLLGVATLRRAEADWELEWMPD